MREDGRLGVHDSGSNLNRMNFAPAFGAKLDDPLIKAETEKKFKERKIKIDLEYKKSYDEIERNFELRKKELIQQNQREIEKEKEKWELYK